MVQDDGHRRNSAAPRAPPGSQDRTQVPPGARRRSGSSLAAPGQVMVNCLPRAQLTSQLRTALVTWKQHHRSQRRRAPWPRNPSTVDSTCSRKPSTSSPTSSSPTPPRRRRRRRATPGAPDGGIPRTRSVPLISSGVPHFTYTRNVGLEVVPVVRRRLAITRLSGRATPAARRVARSARGCGSGRSGDP